jgi:hypothetical protein
MAQAVGAVDAVWRGVVRRHRRPLREVAHSVDTLAFKKLD